MKQRKRLLGAKLERVVDCDNISHMRLLAHTRESASLHLYRCHVRKRRPGTCLTLQWHFSHFSKKNLKVYDVRISFIYFTFTPKIYDFYIIMSISPLFGLVVFTGYAFADLDSLRNLKSDLPTPDDR